MREPYIGYVVSRLPDTSRDLTDLAPVAAHLDYLVSIGMNPTMIARSAGVTLRTVQRVLAREYAHTRRSHGAALLAVTPRPHRQQALVLSYGVVRRLEGLAVMGWSGRVIGEKAGITHRCLLSMRNEGAACTWNVHVQMDAAYQRLSHLDGGNTRTKRWAAAQGFTHPMLWDDIDDYDEVPSVPKPDSRAAFWDEYEHFRGFGWDDRRIAEALGMQLETFQARVRRNSEVAA